MAIDRIDCHWEFITDDVSEDELLERAGAHIGYYMEWAYKRGFSPTNPETNNIENYQKVVNSEINGLQFLIEYCDSKFWEVDLNEEGQEFTSFAYDKYLNNLEEILEHKPYTEKYNQIDLQRVFAYLDKVYEEYVMNLPKDKIKEEKQTFFTKIKNSLFKS